MLNRGVLLFCSINTQKIRRSHLLLPSGFQHLFCAAHQLILVFDFLLQNCHFHLQLADQTLLLMDCRVQSAVLPPERQDLLLRTLGVLHT